MLSRTQGKETTFQVYDDFASWNTNVWATDTNDGATGAVAALETAGSAGGWLSLATAAALNDYHVISGRKVFEFLANRPVHAEIRLKVTEAGANSSHWFFGLTDTLTGGFMADTTGLPPASYRGAVLYKPTGATAIQVQTANGSTKTTNATAGVFASGTILTLGFTFDPGNGTTGKVQFYINGQGTNSQFVKIAPHSVALSGFTPMALAFGVKAGTTSAETMLTDYVGGEITR